MSYRLRLSLYLLLPAAIAAAVVIACGLLYGFKAGAYWVPSIVNLLLASLFVNRPPKADVWDPAATKAAIEEYRQNQTKSMELSTFFGLIGALILVFGVMVHHLIG